MTGADRKAAWHPGLSLYSLVLAGLLMASPSWADGIEWQDLDRDQQSTLSDFRDRWRELPPERRETLVRSADRWRSLPPDQREAIQQRWREIKPLPPEARDALRQRWDTMNTDERREVMRDLRRQSAPPEPAAGLQKLHQHN